MLDASVAALDSPIGVWLASVHAHAEPLEHAPVAARADRAVQADRTNASPGGREGPDVDWHATTQGDGPPGQAARGGARRCYITGAGASLTEALTPQRVHSWLRSRCDHEGHTQCGRAEARSKFGPGSILAYYSTNATFPDTL